MGILSKFDYWHLSRHFYGENERWIRTSPGRGLVVCCSPKTVTKIFQPKQYFENVLLIEKLYSISLTLNSFFKWLRVTRGCNPGAAHLSYHTVSLAFSLDFYPSRNLDRKIPYEFSRLFLWQFKAIHAQMEYHGISWKVPVSWLLPLIFSSSL